jgi:hypothetical protein
MACAVSFKPFSMEDTVQSYAVRGGGLSDTGTGLSLSTVIYHPTLGLGGVLCEGMLFRPLVRKIE